jgi:hypothetical protein
LCFYSDHIHRNIAFFSFSLLLLLPLQLKRILQGQKYRYWVLLLLHTYWGQQTAVVTAPFTNTAGVCQPDGHAPGLKTCVGWFFPNPRKPEGKHVVSMDCTMAFWSSMPPGAWLTLYGSYVQLELQSVGWVKMVVRGAVIVVSLIFATWIIALGYRIFRAFSSFFDVGVREFEVLKIVKIPKTCLNVNCKNRLLATATKCCTLSFQGAKSCIQEVWVKKEKKVEIKLNRTGRKWKTLPQISTLQ